MPHLLDSDDDSIIIGQLDSPSLSVESEHWLDDAEDFFDNEYDNEEEIDYGDWD